MQKIGLILAFHAKDLVRKQLSNELVFGVRLCGSTRYKLRTADGCDVPVVFAGHVLRSLAYVWLFSPRNRALVAGSSELSCRWDYRSLFSHSLFANVVALDRNFSIS